MTPELEKELSQLMVLAQGGDKHAYGALLERLGTLLRVMALRRLPRDSVEDGIQNVLVAIHRARHTYDPSRPFAPWFQALARNRLTDTWRKVERTHRRELARTDLVEIAAAGDQGQAREDQVAVRAAVAQLPVRQRRVIELLKLEQRSVKEVATILDMSESAVKVTAHRAYRALRRNLGGRDADC
jgi:RNA polymerase sigma-70 factor, ECF subfamily